MTEVEFTNGSPVISLDKEQYKDDTLKDVIISIGFHLEQGEESLAEERFLKYSKYLIHISHSSVAPTDAPILLDFVVQIILYCKEKPSFYTRNTRFVQHSSYGIA